MSRILLVENDIEVAKNVVATLELEKYEVSWARDLASAVKLNASEKFELAILDLSFPDGNGLSFCANLRSAGSRLPIIILTAQVHEDCVVESFNTGADDYIEKPFRPKILLARIRRALNEPLRISQKYHYGDMTMQILERRVFAEGLEFDLSRREFDILRYFMSKPESVITRETLVAAISGESDISDRTIDSHVCRLRRQLKLAGIKKLQIASVYGVGYRLEKLFRI